MNEIPEVFEVFEQKLAHVLSFTIIAQRNNTKQAIEELLAYFSGIVERASKAESRIAELEAFIDRIIEAGDAMSNAQSMWVAEEGKWDALVKDWKERER